MYKSVSAFAPIANPSNCPWGEKAFKGYLGEDREIWKKHDATELIKGWKGAFEALIDGKCSDGYVLISYSKALFGIVQHPSCI